MFGLTSALCFFFFICLSIQDVIRPCPQFVYFSCSCHDYEMPVVVPVGMCFDQTGRGKCIPCPSEYQDYVRCDFCLQGNCPVCFAAEYGSFQIQRSTHYAAAAQRENQTLLLNSAAEKNPAPVLLSSSKNKMHYVFLSSPENLQNIHGLQQLQGGNRNGEHLRKARFIQNSIEDPPPYQRYLKKYFPFDYPPHKLVPLLIPVDKLDLFKRSHSGKVNDGHLHNDSKYRKGSSDSASENEAKDEESKNPSRNQDERIKDLLVHGAKYLKNKGGMYEKTAPKLTFLDVNLKNRKRKSDDDLPSNMSSDMNASNQKYGSLPELSSNKNKIFGETNAKADVTHLLKKYKSMNETEFKKSHSDLINMNREKFDTDSVDTFSYVKPNAYGEIGKVGNVLERDANATARVLSKEYCKLNAMTRDMNILHSAQEYTFNCFIDPTDKVRQDHSVYLDPNNVLTVVLTTDEYLSLLKDLRRCFVDNLHLIRMLDEAFDVSSCPFTFLPNLALKIIRNNPWKENCLVNEVVKLKKVVEKYMSFLVVGHLISFCKSAPEFSTLNKRNDTNFAGYLGLDMRLTTDFKSQINRRPSFEMLSVVGNSERQEKHSPSESYDDWYFRWNRDDNNYFKNFRSDFIQKFLNMGKHPLNGYSIDETYVIQPMNHINNVGRELPFARLLPFPLSNEFESDYMKHKRNSKRQTTYVSNAHFPEFNIFPSFMDDMSNSFNLQKMPFPFHKYLRDIGKILKNDYSYEDNSNLRMPLGLSVLNVRLSSTDPKTFFPHLRNNATFILMSNASDKMSNNLKFAPRPIFVNTRNTKGDQKYENFSDPEKKSGQKIVAKKVNTEEKRMFSNITNRKDILAPEHNSADLQHIIRFKDEILNKQSEYESNENFLLQNKTTKLVSKENFKNVPSAKNADRGAHENPFFFKTKDATNTSNTNIAHSKRKDLFSEYHNASGFGKYKTYNYSNKTEKDMNTVDEKTNNASGKDSKHGDLYHKYNSASFRKHEIQGDSNKTDEKMSNTGKENYTAYAETNTVNDNKTDENKNKNSMENKATETNTVNEKTAHVEKKTKIVLDESNKMSNYITDEKEKMTGNFFKSRKLLQLGRFGTQLPENANIAPVSDEEWTIHQRNRRDLLGDDWCPIERRTKYGQIRCVEKSYRKDCEITCVPGYSYKGKPTQKFECLRKKPKWNPPDMYCTEDKTGANGQINDEMNDDAWMNKDEGDENAKEFDEEKFKDTGASINTEDKYGDYDDGGQFGDDYNFKDEETIPNGNDKTDIENKIKKDDYDYEDPEKYEDKQIDTL